MPQKRWLYWSLGALLIIAVLAYVLMPRPVLVETATAARSAMQVTIEEEGITRVKHRYVVSAPVAGYLHRITKDVGEPVAMGEQLAVLEPLPSVVLDPRRRAEAEAHVAAARSALLSTEQQVAAAKADADFAKTELDRKKPLAVKGAISAESLSEAISLQRRADAVLQSARFAVDVARYELDAASTSLQYSAAKSSADVLTEQVPVSAPVDGALLKIFKESEGVIPAGTPLVEVGDSRALEVAVDALSSDAIRIRTGTPVLLKRWGGEILEARVRTVEPIGFTKVSALGVEEQRVWIIVDIISPANLWQTLGDGYRVEAEFLLWQADNVLVIPDSALFKAQGEWATFTIDNGRATLKKIKIGRRNGLQVQLLDGIEEGQTVIVYPDRRIDNTMRVRAR